MISHCVKCGGEFYPFDDPGWYFEYCPKCKPPLSTAEYQETCREQGSHAAEDREARQRSLGMLDGKGQMWWGNGRLR